MTTKIYNMSEEDVADVLEEISEMPQPVYIYWYVNDDEWYVVSNKEIADEDLDNVATDLISDLEDEEDSDEWD